MLTCYDASFAAVLDAAGVDTLLIGDSLGMVMQGHEIDAAGDAARHGLPHRVRGARHEARLHHRRHAVRHLPDLAGARRSATPRELMAAGAHMVKIEGGAADGRHRRASSTERGIPVCGHLGLTPQSVHQLGGYRVQGKQRERRRARTGRRRASAGRGRRRHDRARSDARRARADVTEALRDSHHRHRRRRATAPARCWCCTTCSTSIPASKAKFVKNFMRDAGSIQAAVEAYVKEVKAKTFPRPGALVLGGRHTPSGASCHASDNLTLSPWTSFTPSPSCASACSASRTTCSCRPWAICTKGTSSSYASPSRARRARWSAYS